MSRGRALPMGNIRSPSLFLLVFLVPVQVLCYINFWSKEWKAIEVEAGSARVQALAPLVTPSKLLDSVLTSLAESDKPDLAEGLGILNPWSKVDESIVRDAVWDKYRNLYVDFEKTLQKRATQAEVSKAKVEQSDLDIKRADPLDLFSEAVSIGVKRELAAQGLSSEAVDDDMNASSALSEFVSTIQKNGQSLAAEAGQNQHHTFAKPSPKGKAKPKAKAKQFAHAGNASQSSKGKNGKNGPRGGRNIP